jgi:hypothetical protein
MTAKEEAIKIYNDFITIPYPTNHDRALLCSVILVRSKIETCNKLINV